MTFVIKKTDGKQEYAARFGGARSYTSKLQNAQTFTTREEAEKHRCGNEQIVTLSAEMGT